MKLLFVILSQLKYSRPPHILVYRACTGQVLQYLVNLIPYFPYHSYSPPLCVKNHILLPYNPTTLSQNCGVRHRHGFAAKPFMVLYETSTTPAMDSCLFASQLI